MDESVLTAALDALYGLAREDFVGERDRRVKELKAAGLREEAAAVKAARKPTVPAWTVDQIARQRPDDIANLVAAGDDLRAAQQRASSGQGAEELRVSAANVRGLVRDLTQEGTAILERAGTSPGAHVDGIERTLFTAAVTPEHHETLRRGVFARPLEGAGFGGIQGLLLAPRPAEQAGSQEGETDADTAVAGSRERTDAEREQDLRRRQQERRRVQERRRLERQQRDLQRAHDNQQRRVDRADEKVAQLRERLDRAESAAREQRDARERIEAEMADIAQQLDALAQ